MTSTIDTKVQNFPSESFSLFGKQDILNDFDITTRISYDQQGAAQIVETFAVDDEGRLTERGYFMSADKSHYVTPEGKIPAEEFEKKERQNPKQLQISLILGKEELTINDYLRDMDCSAYHHHPID